MVKKCGIVKLKKIKTHKEIVALMKVFDLEKDVKDEDDDTDELEQLVLAALIEASEEL